MSKISILFAVLLCGCVGQTKPSQSNPMIEGKTTLCWQIQEINSGKTHYSFRLPSSVAINEDQLCIIGSDEVIRISNTWVATPVQYSKIKANMFFQE